MFKKILIANRGEIAIRVIRSAQEMGIKTVAVYSDADKDSLHVKMADEAYHIGNSPANESYLIADKIIDVAHKSGAEAIHPGYGFLSENASFSERCKKENIEFIGPSAYAIQTMGDKITSRKTMIEAGVQVVPGYEDFKGTDEQLLAEAKKVGYPIMVKATAGGGGKGMRLVNSADELINSVNMAKNEAKSSFGNDTVYIEKYISSPHHIEFQIMADKHGNVVHINERECSVQRRNQKVIEETPSPLMTAKLRNKMGEQAVLAAKSVDYIGAGTVEFLVDDDLNYYFLEMNTRLQVEHPITEQTSGIDLVKEQLNVAFGKKLSFKQKDIKQNGHSIECRIYAEDPDNNFMPSPGKITYLKKPKNKNVRIDGYVYAGYSIPIFYDPMISKLIVWGENRKQAIKNMKNALKEYRIIGFKHNIPYLHKILSHKKFKEGKYDTRFIGLYEKDLKEDSNSNKKEVRMASITAFIDYKRKVDENMNRLHLDNSAKIKKIKKLDIGINEEKQELELINQQGIFYKLIVNNKSCGIDFRQISEFEYVFETAKKEQFIVIVPFENNRKKYYINFGLNTYIADIVDFQTKYALARQRDAEEDKNIITTPMPGKIVKILVKKGDKISEGDTIIIVEAMKMQSEYKATSNKTVKEINVKEGDTIEGNQALVILE